MGTPTYYVEAFVEFPDFGYRWRVWNNGEGMIEFDYQEYKDGEWRKGKFTGIPADHAEQFMTAINAVKCCPV